MRSPRTLAGLFAFAVLGAGACEHDPEIERHGDPMPDAGETTNPPSCTDGAGGEGGVLSTPVSFCQAEIVLREVCQRCHQNPPLNGAPFPLVTYEDTQEEFRPEKARWERMKEVVESGFMPLLTDALDPPVVPLTCEQRSTLLGWLNQCARPEGGTDCSAGTAELLVCD